MYSLSASSFIVFVPALKITGNKGGVVNFYFIFFAGDPWQEVNQRVVPM